MQATGLDLLKWVIARSIEDAGISALPEEIEVERVEEKACFRVVNEGRCGAQYCILVVHYRFKPGGTHEYKHHDVFVIQMPEEDTGLACAVPHYLVDMVGHGPVRDLVDINQEQLDNLAETLLELAEKHKNPSSE